MASGNAPRCAAASGIFAAAALLAPTLIVFAQTAALDFVDYDDGLWIVENEHLQAGLTLESAGWALTTFYAGSWTPLARVSERRDVLSGLFMMLTLGAYLFSTRSPGWRRP